MKLMSIPEIKKEDLIDTDENKPIEEQESVQEKEPATQPQQEPLFRNNSKNNLKIYIFYFH